MGKIEWERSPALSELILKPKQVKRSYGTMVFFKSNVKGSGKISSFMIKTVMMSLVGKLVSWKNQGTEYV